MRKPDERGIALLLTLLVLTLLVALILEFDAEARREYRDAAAFRDNFKATVLARAAVQAARGVLQQDILKEKLTGQSFDAPTDLWAFPIKNYTIGDGLLNAQIEDELGKLNLNDLGIAGEANAKATTVKKFKRLFELVQVNPDLVDAIVDWVDDNEVQEPAGAESLYYQAQRPSYKAANTHLQTLLELRLIKGITPDMIEKLSTVVTVFPIEGGKMVNINTAGPLVLQALDPRITQGMAADIIQARPFKTKVDLDRVGSAEEIGKQIRNQYDIKSDLFSARMTVSVNEVTKNAIVVLQRDSSTGVSTVQYYRVL
ncbi:MAG TPA: type II secretion system minor pseudopilin GspK [Nitrospiraceae bacterium]|nr:type II secretion system minor pseudopilin GspK [Nitrospiraceae bacterium]